MTWKMIKIIVCCCFLNYLTIFYLFEWLRNKLNIEILEYYSIRRETILY